MTTKVDAEPGFSIHDYSEFHEPEVADPEHALVIPTGGYEHVGVHPRQDRLEDNSMHISDHTDEKSPYTEVSFGHMGSVGKPIRIAAGSFVDARKKPALRGVRITVIAPDADQA